MTRENEEQLLKDVKSMKDELHVLRISIIGNPLAKPDAEIGVLDLLKTHKTELYGDHETQHIGLKKKFEDHDERLKKLEHARREIYMTAGGISTGIGIAWYFAQLFFGK